jgi:thiosulfate reductase cytochrome b subunit
MAERVYIYKRFERFWHWSQAALIIFLMLTGFEVHGSYQLFGFEKAVNLHTTAAWCLIGLWVFALFWHVTIGEWRQYVPTVDKIGAIINYYTIGIFSNAPHPFHRTAQRKHNPLQRLTYLLILVLVSPLIWVTGLLYLFYGNLEQWGLHDLNLRWIALGHTLGAYLMLSFLIAHFYLGTTGHTVMSHFKAMTTGWDEA